MNSSRLGNPSTERKERKSNGLLVSTAFPPLEPISVLSYNACIARHPLKMRRGFGMGSLLPRVKATYRLKDRTNEEDHSFSPIH
jgi:hypothetical protein